MKKLKKIIKIEKIIEKKSLKLKKLLKKMIKIEKKY